MYNPNDPKNDNMLVPNSLCNQSNNIEETKKDKETLTATYLLEKPQPNDIFWKDAALAIASRMFQIASKKDNGITLKVKLSDKVQLWNYRTETDLADALLGKGTIRFPLGLMECDYLYRNKSGVCSLLEAIFFTDNLDNQTQYDAMALVLLDPKILFFKTGSSIRAIFDHVIFDRKAEQFLLKLLASGLLSGDAETIGHIKQWLKKPTRMMSWVDQKEPFEEYMLRTMLTVPEIFKHSVKIGEVFQEDEWAKTLKAVQHGASWAKITTLLFESADETVPPNNIVLNMQRYIEYFMTTPMYTYQFEMFKKYTDFVSIDDVVDAMDATVKKIGVGIHVTDVLCEYMVERLNSDECEGDDLSAQRRANSFEKMAAIKLASLKNKRPIHEITKIEHQIDSVESELARLKNRPDKNDPYWTNTARELLAFVFPVGVKETRELLSNQWIHHNEKDINNNVLSKSRLSSVRCSRNDCSLALVEAIVTDTEMTKEKRIKFIVFLALHDPSTMFYMLRDREVNIFEHLSEREDFDEYPSDFYGELMLSLLSSDNFCVRKKIIAWFDNTKTIRIKSNAQSDLMGSFLKKSEDAVSGVDDHRCLKVFSAILAFGSDGFRGKMKKMLGKNNAWKIENVTDSLLKDLENIGSEERAERQSVGYEMLWNLMQIIEIELSYQLLFSFHHAQEKSEGAKNLSGFISWLVASKPWEDVQKYFIKMREEAANVKSELAGMNKYSVANLRDMHFMMLGHYLKSCREHGKHNDSYRVSMIAESFLNPSEIKQDIINAERFFEHKDLSFAVFKEYMAKKGKISHEALIACQDTSVGFQETLREVFMSSLVKNDIVKQIQGAIAVGLEPERALAICVDNNVKDMNVFKYFIENSVELELDIFGNDDQSKIAKAKRLDLRSDLLLCLPEGKWNRPKEKSLVQDFYDMVNENIYESCTQEALEARPEFFDKFFEHSIKTGRNLAANKFWGKFFLDEAFPLVKILDGYRIIPQEVLTKLLSSKNFVTKFKALSDADFSKLSQQQKEGYFVFCGKLNHIKALASSDNSRGIVIAGVLNGTFNAKDVAQVALAQNKHVLFGAILKSISYEQLVELTQGKQYSKECTQLVTKRFEEFKYIDQDETLQSMLESLEKQCRIALKCQSQALKEHVSFVASSVLFSTRRPPLLAKEMDVLEKIEHGCTEDALTNLHEVIAESKEAVRKLK